MGQRRSDDGTGRATATTRLAGLDGEVRLRRDGAGIPIVAAETVGDLCFGQGYTDVTDRLWQLEWDRTRALGRSAALIGSANNVFSDAFHRRARLADAARSGFGQLRPDTRQLLTAYAAGVNAALAELHEPPVELHALDHRVDPWEPWHSVAVFAVRHLTFGTFANKLWNARVLATLGPDAIARFRTEGQANPVPVIVPPGLVADLRSAVGTFDSAVDPEIAAALAPFGLPFSGSNAWVVSGARTASGKPLLAGDPHRALEVPNVYHQVRLITTDISAAGFTFAGVPGICHFGQTADLAWGITNAGVDYQDLFIERLAADPSCVTDARVETIEVRDGEPLEVECLTTAHGPVVIGDRQVGIGLALATAGLTECGGSLNCLEPLLRARSGAAADAALDDWVEPANNWVLADSAGHIGYRLAGRFPDRHPLHAVLPVPGWDPAYDWRGFVAAADLPRAIDPAVGTIVTANQRITTAAVDDRLGAHYFGPFRAQRIKDLLGDRTDLTVADMEAIQRDAVWIPGQRLAALLRQVDAEAATQLASWDGAMDAASPDAALVGQVFHELCRILTAALPEPLRTNPFTLWEPPAAVFPVEMRVAFAVPDILATGDVSFLTDRPLEDLVREALRAARVQLRAMTGSGSAGSVVWGDLHQAFPTHAANGVPGLDGSIQPSLGPVSGGFDCVLATMQVGGLLTHALLGPTARYIWDVADPAASRWIVPLGASGNPASPHFADQTADWVAGTTRPVLDD
jgi:penicillin amidase